MFRIRMGRCKQLLHEKTNQQQSDHQSVPHCTTVPNSTLYFSTPIRYGNIILFLVKLHSKSKNKYACVLINFIKPSKQCLSSTNDMTQWCNIDLFDIWHTLQ